MKKYLKFIIIAAVAVPFVFFFIQGAVDAGTKDKSEEQPSSADATSNDKTCIYSVAEVKAMEVGTDKVIDEKSIKGCYTVSRMEMGLVEISSDNGIKVVYYDENPLQSLDIFISGKEPVRWRSKQGHDIFKVMKDGKTTFIFSDRKRIKGTISFQ